MQGDRVYRFLIGLLLVDHSHYPAQTVALLKGAVMAAEI